MKHGRGRYVSADRSVINDGEWRGGHFVGGDVSQMPYGAAQSILSGRSGMMNSNMPMPGQNMSVVQPFVSPSGGIMPTIPPFQPNYMNTSSYMGPTSGPMGAASAYRGPTSSNYMPPAALSAYNPQSGLPPVSMYSPGTITPVSNYIPPNLSITPASQYNPGIMTGGSNMSFRGR
jgi:hypothetical protein